MAKRALKSNSHFIGIFTLPDGQSVMGNLQLESADTVLNIYSEKEFKEIEFGACIKGVASTGEHLTLIDCYTLGVGPSGSKDNGIRYHAKIFPHYVTIGGNHIIPDQHQIQSISFTTTDLKTIFHDSDSFGYVYNAKSKLDSILKEQYKNREIKIGELPVLLYFTGKYQISEINTLFGKISISHSPRYTTGGPEGVSIKNRLVVSVEPERPMTIDGALDCIHSMHSFLSMAAGRFQGVTHIHAVTTQLIGDRPDVQVVHPKFPWSASKNSRTAPHPRDVPLDPIQRQAEFSSVLIDWINRHNDWKIARARYLGCLRNNEYGPERLVAAANMFDILPARDTPVTTELLPDLAETRDACIRMFRNHPNTPDRNNAIASLSRLGKPSLPKKVAHRVSIIDAEIGDKLLDLQSVARLSVKTRNYFVHGSSDGFDYQKLEEFVPFLTDTLEFIFSASDFIQAGWDAKRWALSPHFGGHSFARFLREYQPTMTELRKRVPVQSTNATNSG